MVSATFGDLTKELTTVVSPSMLTSRRQQSELFDELLDLARTDVHRKLLVADELLDFLHVEIAWQLALGDLAFDLLGPVHFASD